MARTRMGIVGCGGRMGRRLVAEIAATEGCAVAGGSEAPGSGYVNQDIAVRPAKSAAGRPRSAVMSRFEGNSPGERRPLRSARVAGMPRARTRPSRIKKIAIYDTIRVAIFL
jgi:hypothetical protein